MAFLCGTAWLSRYLKGLTIWILLKQETVAVWQWQQICFTILALYKFVCMAICKSAHSTPPLRFFTSQIPFLLPNQQHQNTEGQMFIVFILK